ncbi:MAG: threonine--tRNA ligase [Myxococcales bacterium]|nr:threonine--tRNA ligase [Myxococcales bacterium]
MKKETNEKLYRIRHSLSHVLATAVKELYPQARLGIGPPVDTGFYYDFVFPEPITAEELPKIEKKMKHLVKQNIAFQRFELPGEEALQKLESGNEPYKVEMCREYIAAGEAISFYQSGAFTDMCEGPHVENTNQIDPQSFELDTIAGAYWRGDENNIMMTRIYGLAFETREELELFKKRRALAQERDHRKLGKELQIYTIAEEVGKGLPLWLPNGGILRRELEKLAYEAEFKQGYSFVNTPHLANAALYRTSGHLAHYKDSMYPPMILDDEEYYMKPMNCPHHHMIYRQVARSYRDLPLRLTEYGSVYRFEKSGELAGLLRVRGMTMNDAHLYVDEERLLEELIKVMELHKYYYNLFGMDNYWVRLSIHDINKDKFVDNIELWERTIAIMREMLKQIGLPYEEVAGEAAFYGPKVDFQVSNVIGREETASTNQLDFTSAFRFDLKYVDRDGQEKRPYIIHRAPLGTHERFISFLIEHYGGAFPTWLAPVQVRLVPVAPDLYEYAHRLEAELHERLVRVQVDDSSDSFNKKIRNAATEKVPNVLVLGAREKEAEAVTHRRYGIKEQQTLPFREFAAWLDDEIRLRRNSRPLNPLDKL